MGTSCSWKLDADYHAANDPFIIQTANSILLENGDDSKIENFMWKRWSHETKWWAPDFVQKLSQKIDLVFKLQATGDENFTWYFYKGSILSEEEIWERPKFPSRPVFKKRLTIATQKRAEQKRLRDEAYAKAEKEKLEKQIAELKAKQEQLQRRLAI